MPTEPTPSPDKVRHDTVAQELMQGIASGRYPVGSLLPTELELCERYGTSRHTVRVALKSLQELGLVSRRKNVGTRVESATASSGYVQSLASVEDLTQFGIAHLRRVRRIDEVVADLALAEELGCPGGMRWLRVSSLRLEGARGGTPIGWTDVYVDVAYAEVADLVRASPDTLISSLIESRYGRRIVRIRQDIEAVAMPAALAADLDVEPGSPALKVRRRYLDARGEAFEISLSFHPAGRFRFSMQLQRSGEPAA